MRMTTDKTRPPNLAAAAIDMVLGLLVCLVSDLAYLDVVIS